jgi:hypothetical protein
MVMKSSVFCDIVRGYVVFLKLEEYHFHPEGLRVSQVRNQYEAGSKHCKGLVGMLHFIETKGY